MPIHFYRLAEFIEILARTTERIYRLSAITKDFLAA